MQSLLAVKFGEIFGGLYGQMGFAQGNWQNYVMILISFALIYLAIVKKFEPMLLLPIAFGMFLINIPGAESVLWGEPTPATDCKLGVSGAAEYAAAYTDGTSNLIYIRDGFLNNGMVTYYSSFNDLAANITSQMPVEEFNLLWTKCGFVSGAVTEAGTVFSDAALIMNTSYGAVAEETRGLLWYMYYGVDKVIYPPLIFLGIGAMTDFGPLIANPKSMLIGAGAQLGVFLAFILATFFGFSVAAAASIAIIGGADGPTAILVTTKLSSDLLPMIAIAAYSYMALIPIIQKPLMKLLTTKKERAIRMKPLRKVSKLEKILFPIIVTLVMGIILPDSIALLGMLMLGNLLRESGVVDRLSSQAQNGLMNTVTIFLGIAVGSKAKGELFLSVQTIEIILIGLFSFMVGTIGGLLTAKILCKVTKGQINPLIGSAGVSAVPMAARISEDVGRQYDPQNHLLMHAMGPNVAGVIGSAIAAGVLLACFGGYADGAAAQSAVQNITAII